MTSPPAGDASRGMLNDRDQDRGAMTAGRVMRVRLRPLEAAAYEYRGDADEVPAIEVLLGVPVRRQENGDIILTCPAPREPGAAGGPAASRRAVLRPGMPVVRFAGDKFRFTVTDAFAYEFMYEALEDEGETAGVSREIGP